MAIVNRIVLIWPPHAVLNVSTIAFASYEYSARVWARDCPSAVLYSGYMFHNQRQKYGVRVQSSVILRTV